MVWENDGSWPLSEFMSSLDDFSNVQMTEWDQNNQKVMTFDTVISGVPFINSTRSRAIFTKKIKTENLAVVEIASETFDLP